MSGACDQCLERSALISSLAGRIEIARREKRYVRDVLALPDAELRRALGVASGADGGPGPSDAVLARVERAGLSAICRHQPAYPQQLLADASAPPVLYVAGRAGRFVELAGGGRPVPVVAIVGARRASADGLEFARRLGRELSVAGVTVVSGMALGIDGAAHDGALGGGGRTIAVLAGSPEVAYPRRRRVTHAEICDRAAVVSETPPGGPVFAWSFLARNRIIAGLAEMTIVVEAADRSGSLVTAEMALELGREVGAVPGSPLNWRTSGTHELLREGAALVARAEDVLERLAFVPAGPPPAEELPAPLSALVADVRSGRDTVSDLASAHGGAGAVQAGLTELEMRGIVTRTPGGRVGVTGPGA